jgi:PleD family two-component response regulator
VTAIFQKLDLRQVPEDHRRVRPWSICTSRVNLIAGSQPARQANPMPPRALIIDDDAAPRAKVGVLLASRGHLVSGEAGNVAEARDAVGELRPNAVLLDVNLPRYLDP